MYVLLVIYVLTREKKRERWGEEGRKKRERKEREERRRRKSVCVKGKGG